MRRTVIICLLLFLVFDACAMQITASTAADTKKARLDEIIAATNCPKVTLDDINLFIEDDKGAMVKKLVLEDDQCKNKKICIDFTERSLCEKITDKINYLAPRGLTYVAIDLANSQINCAVERV